MTEITMHVSDSGVATLVVSNPSRKNAIDGAGWRRLLELIGDARGDRRVRALVVEGGGENFSSGADLSDFPTSAPERIERMRVIAEVIRSLFYLPKPTLAKVRGVCVGASFGLALACDVVVCSEGARFCEIFARRGLAADGGTSWLLPRVVGLQRAISMAYFAEFVSGREAERMGLVARCVPEEDLDATAAAMAEKLASGPTVALGYTKLLMKSAFETDIDAALAGEGSAQCVVFTTSDVVEAMRAFAERRDPRFEGR